MSLLKCLHLLGSKAENSLLQRTARARCKKVWCGTYFSLFRGDSHIRTWLILTIGRFLTTCSVALSAYFSFQTQLCSFKNLNGAFPDILCRGLWWHGVAAHLCHSWSSFVLPPLPVLGARREDISSKCKLVSPGDSTRHSSNSSC